MLRRRVQFHADVVHAGNHDVIERTLQRGLIDVVLILPHADALRVELHEFGERVHEPTPDAHRAAHGEVVVRKFLPRRFARRVNGRAAFIHHDDRNAGGQPERSDECLRLASRRAVANRDGLDVEFLHDRLHELRRFSRFASAFLRVNHVVPDELSLPVEHDHFASRAKTRIDGEHRLLPKRRGEQQFAEIACEDARGFLVGLLFETEPRFALHRETEQPLVTVMHRLADLQRCRGAIPHEERFQNAERVLLRRLEA